MLNVDRTFVIAEAGVNHNGSVDIALQLVEVAARAGADAVKFQTFNAESLVSASAPKAHYQIENTGKDGSQLDMLRQLELSPDAYCSIAARCKELGIGFMSTAFDVDSLRFLDTFEMPAVKIGSGDVTAAPLVLEAARLGRPLIVSTGMCTLDEIEEALGVIAYGLSGNAQPPSRAAFAAAYASDTGRATLIDKVTLLHCVTQYPAPVAEVNLKAMDLMRKKFGLRVGYSDHTMGTAVALAAVARGATVLEKHFTLDASLAGPDHKASLEPDEFVRLVQEVRNIEAALGMERKEPTASEMDNRVIARRSLVAARAIARGEAFADDNVAVKRPGGGLAPIAYWETLGRYASRDYAADDLIEP